MNEFKSFWGASTMRAVRTFWQVFPLLGGAELLNLVDMGIIAAFFISAAAIIASFCMSMILGVPEVPESVDD